MIKNINDVMQQQAEDALKRLGVVDVVNASYITDSIIHQNAYWERHLPNGKKLLFVRFFVPVIQREEVFLGNVLFNAFLSKAFARAIITSELGNVELVANDLENYYFLIQTDSDVNQLTEAFQDEVECSLPDLFFGDANEERGIYGSLERMLEFRKANVEPFPLFSIPECYADQLESIVRQSLQRKIGETSFDRNPTSITANLSFFYSRDSKEMQSPPLLLGRLATHHNIVTTDALCQALNLGEDTDFADEKSLKTTIENSLKQQKGKSFSPVHLRKLLEQVVSELGKRIETNPENWRMPYVQNKLLPYDERSLTEILLSGVSIGYVMMVDTPEQSTIECRVSGRSLAVLEDKSILMGQSTHRFHNQAVRQKNAKEPKISIQCAMYSYLIVKLMGSEAIGQPQVPKTYNLIFHYGQLDNQKINQITRQMDLIWNLVWQHRDTRGIRRDIDNQRHDLEEKLNQAKEAKKKDELSQQLSQKNTQLEQADAEIAAVEDGILRNCPWWKRADVSFAPAENPSLDTLSSSQQLRQQMQNEAEGYSIDENDVQSICPWWKREDAAALSHRSARFSLETLVNIQSSESKFERHVLGLGMGGYRMILFVLPQIRAPRGKEHDFTQRRFSNSRVTVTAMLSFLRELSESKGPFYYQSLPTLTPNAFSSDTFYIRNQPISVNQAQQEYEAVTQLAWKLIRMPGSEGLVKKVVLAEKLLAEPLSTFSTVMRDSRILGQTADSYKRLRGQYRPDWGAHDLTEYAKFIQRLSKLQEENPMALQIDREELDEFCPKLFHALDVLDRLPQGLSWKQDASGKRQRIAPTEFEKFPRLLFGTIHRYNDVEAGFREWQSRLMRDIESPTLREKNYLELEELCNWMMHHEKVFRNKTNLQHLRSSLYARVFNYLYPRRVLANSYCLKHKGNVDAIKAEVLEHQFPSSIEQEIQKLKETYIDDWEAIVADVRSNLTDAPYYRSVVEDKVKTDLPDDLEATKSEKQKEDSL